MAAAHRRRGGPAAPAAPTALERYVRAPRRRASPTGSTACTSSWTPPTAPPRSPRPRRSAAAGARVSVIGASPDGLNINDGYGSTHLERLCEAVLAEGADFGVAHDGDADRCLAVDGSGTPVDGDQIMSILAISLRDKGRLVVRHSGRHGHVEPRHAAGDGAVGDHRAPDRGRGPLRPRGHEGRRVCLGRRAERPRDPAGARHHRRRRPHRTDARGPRRRDRPVAHRARLGDDPAAAGPRQRAGCRHVEGRLPRGAAGGRRQGVGRAGRQRPRAAAQVRYRAAGPRDGRGGRRVAGAGGGAATGGLGPHAPRPCGDDGGAA